MKNLLTILTVLLLCGFHSDNNTDILKAIDRLEVLQAWVKIDIQTGHTDSLRGETYIYNIDKAISILEN